MVRFRGLAQLYTDQFDIISNLETPLLATEVTKTICRKVTKANVVICLTSNI